MRSKRRGKGSAASLLTPMELGLVPAKYLKKNKTKSTVTQTSSQTTPSVLLTTHQTPTPATPHEIMMLEPRILFAQSLAMSSPPPPPPTTNTTMREEPKEKTTSSSSTSRHNISTNQEEEQQQAMDQLDALLGKRGLRSSATSSQLLQDWKRTILRVEGWNVDKAVSRCLHHWRIKAQLWGTPDLKTRLRDVAPHLVHQGSIQLVPVRDAHQRAIVCVHFSSRLYATHQHEIQKYLFYMLATALEDVATQDYGISLVVWNTQGIETQGHSISPLSNLLWSPRPSKLTSFLDSFFSLWRSMIHPAFHIATLHYCCLAQDADFSHESWHEKETTIHQYTSQSMQECLHALLTAGIPVEALPMRIDNDHDNDKDDNDVHHKDKDKEADDLSTVSLFDTTRHRMWVEWRQRTDSYHTTSPFQQFILVPRRTDILWGGYGQGNSSRMPPNPGNIMYHQALLERLDEYMALTTTTKNTKTTMSAAVSACRDIYQEQQLGSGAVKCLQALDVQRGILWEEIQDEERIVQHIHHAMEYLADWKRQAMEAAADAMGQDGTATTSRSSKHYTSNVDWEEWLPECCTVLCSPPPLSSSSSSRFCQTSWNTNNTATTTATNNNHDIASMTMTTSSGGQSVGSLHSAWGY